ncbi:Por secretion system C-terminal sorting domain-containing protein [Hymenobacter daecheongensis DSM 21074]|uniref:Por secretion system C-terminal sorting domain-containing protein n=1 Tax=Hymenobacter daecheongensis DSM 21074 TaxID=1121955 RepID=A0A1M6INP6_9BACT|nr:Por secretion system C-terminal sorting domain-containing protein [Hymenobacter daecheongensis DSM 21074]
MLGGAATVGGALVLQKGDLTPAFYVAAERNETEEEDEDRADRPDLAMEQEFELTRDPQTGTVPRERLVTAQAYAQRLINERAASRLAAGSLAQTTWTERGPVNVAGRIRALVVDPADASGNTLWAGAAGGGLWKTTNATAASPTWTTVDNFFSTLAVTAIAFDPRDSNTMYFGTGEGFFNADAARGLGIWKSTNHGATWTQLPATAVGTTFHYVTKLVVHPVSGDVYAGTRSGLQRSTTGGTSWTTVLGAGVGATSSRIADVELGADNTFYVSAGLGEQDGIYRSTTGAANSWTKLNTLPTSGLPTTGYRRIELACAPSDANRVYAIFENSSNAQVLGLYRSNDGGTTWTTMSLPGGTTTALASSQAWYDLAAAVSPTNPDQLYVAGLDIFRTLAANTDPVVWQKVSVWSTTPGSSNFVHADHHVITFASADGNHAYFGNDGGVFISTNAMSTTLAPIFSQRNNGLNVTQFYALAVHPTNVNYFLAGAQDNGTQKYTTAGLNTTTTATGGDGAFCFIDEDEPQYQFSSYVYAQYRRSVNGGASFSTMNISGTEGSFINPTDYDSQTNTLYASYSPGQLLRWPDATTAAASAFNTIPLSPGSVSSRVTHVTVSPNSTGRGRVFVGTNGGRVIRIDDAAGATPVLTDIRLGTGSVSCVAVETGNDNHLLVTYSNYGVVSVWETTDGGTTWRSVEGNLPDMPVRWAMFDPANSQRALLATELGIWATDDLSAPATTWFPASLGMANVRVSMLRMRKSDKQIAAATHGRGLFTSDVFTPTASKSGISISDKLLNGVYPNPFGQQLNVEFQLPVTGEVAFTLIDTQGRKVLSTTRRVAGRQVAVPTPAGLAAGVYLLTVRAGNETATRRVVHR